MNKQIKPKEQVQMLEKGIEELRRTHDEITDAFSKARIKNITFIGANLATLSYLYSSNGSGNESLFIPEKIYGIIFYFAGLFLCLGSLLILVLALQPITWRIPTEMKKLKKLEYNSYLDFLKYVRNEYIEGLSINLPKHEKKQKYLNLASPLLIVGAILLLIIKKFNF